MSIQAQKISHERHRFLSDISVWLYPRINLSQCEVEGMMLERGFDVSYEPIRRLTVKVGAPVAHILRCDSRAPAISGIWTTSL